MNSSGSAASSRKAPYRKPKSDESNSVHMNTYWELSIFRPTIRIAVLSRGVAQPG